MTGGIWALGAASAWAIAAASTASAQTSPEPAAQTSSDAADTDIVVTGIRGSLAAALQAKKSAPNIQEDLAADDIGKLPDNNIAESLARLPGLSTNRDRGNATQISIRGMGPELVNTLLDGRELVSAGPDRNIRYDQYPAELINGASVYKSPTPGQVEGAIAGQVDLKTIRPLDLKKPTFVINGRAEYNDLSHDVQDAKSVGWIASASYVGQFAGDTLGVAIGATARNEPVATERTNIYRYTNSFADLNGDGKGATGNPPIGDNIPYGFEALKRGGSDKRIGALATVQWRPGNGLEVNGDFFYSRVKYAEFQRGFSVQGLPFGNTFTNVSEVDENAVAGTATNYASYGVQLENNNQYYSFTDNLYAGGLNAKYDADRWHFAGDFGYSTTTRNAIFLNEYTEAVYPGTNTVRTDGTTVSYLSRPGQPTSFAFQSLTDQSLNNLTNLEIPSNGNGAPIIHDELYSGKLDIGYDANGFFSAVRAGLRFTSRAKDLTQRTQYSSTGPTAIPASLLGTPLTWSGAFAGIPSSETWDVFAVANQYFGGVHPAESSSDQNASWEVDEKTYAGFVEADFDHDIGGMKLTGNIGVRVVRTEDTSKGAQVSYIGATTVTPLLYHNNFTDWLPSLNATLHIDDHQQVRFALSKAIARAPLDDLNAGYSLYTGGSGTPAATGGNPLLQPYRAKQADLTYEHYFSRDTALTVSLFYKYLDTFIVNNTSSLTVGTTTYPDAFTQPINLKGGNLKGVEVLFQQAFTFLPKPLDGFGVYANYSYTDSSVKVTETDNSIGTSPLPGLSKNVYNLSLYYSKYGVDARVGYRYRSAFLTQTGDTDRLLYNHSEGILSAEVSYEFPSASSLHGIKVALQADNLTNTPYQLYYGSEAQQGRYETFGRRFYGGVTYRF